jgi:aminomethyltransferase
VNAPASLTAAPRRQIREPGLPLFEPGTERYRVAGGGAIVLPLFPGDAVAIVDREGRQRCEIAAFAPDGRGDLAALSLKAKADSTGINRLLAGKGEDARAVGAALRQRGLPGQIGKAALLFEGDSRPGEEARLVAQREVVAIFHALGGPMSLEVPDPPTDLSVIVKRATAPNIIAPPLPAPLADPREEIHIDRCTAQAYVVKAGEYIQIIDVSGRQCSDFLAFNARQLEKGIERGLDMTATRSMTGFGYPGPGLYSKFFDTDLQPLVEVVRDTVGRHDAFGLACTARYYDDVGYPGHANCTDNFNGALQPFGVQARGGWPAINFFYNTGISAQNAYFLEEPWSRPGDYVLLRALTDLVCASSGCPDDIDAANGWNPTDIHLRIYPARNTFSKAISFRMAPDAEPRLTRETAFHPRTSALTRNFAEYRGFWLPTRFNNHGAVDEYWACREKAVVMDLSPLRKFEVVGPDAETLLQLACTRNIRKLAVGQVVYTAMCYEHGGMLDDGTVFRLGANNFRWIGGDEYDGRWLRELAEQHGLKVWVKSSTDQLHNIALQGPNSRDVLKEVIWTPPGQPSVSELAWFQFAIGRIGDFNGAPVVVSRTGYTGELGFEIFCHPKDALTVWDAVWEAGKPHGLAPLGLEALDMVRIEAGLIFFGTEFSDQTDPFEAGIGFAVALKGNEEFVGRDALLKRKENPQRVLVGLELAGGEAAAHGNCVHVGRAQVGVITSGMKSPILKKNIALCRMDVAHAALGTEVEVGKLDGHQKRIPATVVRFPFYDPEKTRVRA